MGNKFKYYTTDILASLISLSVFGAVLQTFLIEYGFSEEKVNYYFSLMQIVQMLAIIGFSSFSDRTHNIIGASAYVKALELPYVLFLLILAFSTEMNGSFVFVILILVGILYNVSVGARNVFACKLPYSIINMKDYGKVASHSGILMGIFSVLFSWALSFLQGRIDYFLSMRIVFAASLVMILAFMALTLMMKPTQVMQPLQKREKINIFKYKPFTRLLLPNLTRGFCGGIIGMGVTIGYYTGTIDLTSAGYIVIITSVMMIFGSFIYSLVMRHIRDGSLILLASVGVAVAMPFLATKSTFIFLIMYTIVFFLKIIIDYAVPVTVTKIIDYKIAGQYSAYRLMLNTLGIVLAGFVCIAAFRLIGVLATMILSGVMQLICGVGYYIYLKRFPPASFLSNRSE